MVRTELGLVEIKGKKSIIEAELGCLFYSLKNRGMFTEDELHNAVHEGCSIKPEDVEEIDGNKLNEVLDKLSSLVDLLDAIEERKKGRD